MRYCAEETVINTLDIAFAVYLLVQLFLVSFIVKGFIRDSGLAIALYYGQIFVALLAWAALFMNSAISPLAPLGLYSILFAVAQFGVGVSLTVLRLLLLRLRSEPEPSRPSQRMW